MKDYDLKGLSIGGRKAVIAVCLPEPNGNKYHIFKSYFVQDTSENKIVIHFKDTHGKPLKHGNNFELLLVDLTGKEFDGIDFNKEINVALCHENKDDLSETPAEVFARAHRPFSNGKTKDLVYPDSTGKGTIRP